MRNKYAVMGNPVSHSKSPFIHQEFAKLTNQDLQYTAIEVPLDQFAVYVQRFQKEGGRGLNITVPFKQQAFFLVTECNDFAKVAGAVNTIRFEDDLMLGFNTDGIGLVRDISKNQGIPLANKRILLLGAGGASRGVLLPLLNEGVKSIVIANRTLSTAEKLVQRFAQFGDVKSLEFPKLAGHEFDIIINGTSASLQNELLPLPTDIIQSHTFCYDMMYSSKQTSFLQQVIEMGCKQHADGIGMLVEQAAESFYIFRGIHPPTDQVLKELRK